MNPAHIWQEWIKPSTKWLAVRTKKMKMIVPCVGYPCCLLALPCSQVFSILSLSDSLPPQWDSAHAGVVLCLISFFSLKSAQLSPLRFSPLHISSISHPLLSLSPLPFLLCTFLSSSTLFSFFLSSALITSQTAFSCLPFYFSSHLLASAPSTSPHVAAQLAPPLCTHASPWPPCLHPLLNYSWGSSPASGGLCREEKRRVQREMEKQVPSPLTAGSDQILCFVKM